MKELTFLLAIPVKVPRGSRGLKECPFNYATSVKQLGIYLFIVLAESLTFVIIKN